MKRISFIVGAGLGLYLVGGALLNYVVFPLSPPDFSDYFHPGDVFGSRAQGDRQTIVRIEKDLVELRTEVFPHAAGPPTHIHRGFDETFTVAQGRLSVAVDGSPQLLAAGESVTIPAGTAHTFANETETTVIIAGADGLLPQTFAAYLSQIYGFLDAAEANQHPPRIVLQMAMWYPHFDSTLATGPPSAVQGVLFWLLQPTARLLGYQNYYAEYRPTRHSEN